MINAVKRHRSRIPEVDKSTARDRATQRNKKEAGG